MLKRIFCIAVSLLLIGNLILFSFAEEKDVTLLHNCDSTFGAFKLDKDNVRGSCLAHTFSAGVNSFANQTQFKPIDASDGDTLAIEVYLSDPAMLANIMAVLSREGANVEHMTNKSRGDYAYTMIDLDSTISDQLRLDLIAIDNVIRVRVLQMH